MDKDGYIFFSTECETTFHSKCQNKTCDCVCHITDKDTNYGIHKTEATKTKR